MSDPVKEKMKRLAILGRPNVGKSTLFNILTNSRKALVKNIEGLTRDIQVEKGEWLNNEFEVLDTGGITRLDSPFAKEIKEQIQEILGSVDLIIFVVDGRVGKTYEDEEVFHLIRQSGIPYFIAVNKIDSVHEEELLKADFYEFSDKLYACSFEQRRGLSDILEEALPYLKSESNTMRKGLNLAIIGKPNVGKSSLCNQLMGERRMIVSNVAGTTTDSIESSFVYNGKDYKISDTAGIRKRSKMENDIELLSSFKAKDAVDRCDLVLLLVDGMQGPSDQDTKLASYIMNQHKPMILVANKLDICEKEIPEYRKQFKQNMAYEFHFNMDIPIVFISAKTGAGLKKLFLKIEDIEKRMKTKVPTSKLNNFFKEIVARTPAPVHKGKNLKFFYLTQTEQQPPSFIAFVNQAEGLSQSYRRYLIKNLKEKFELKEMPIRIYAMAAKSKITKNKKEIIKQKKNDLEVGP